MSKIKKEYDLLISEFMGLSVTELHGDICFADGDGMHSVKYSESWDWLLPVFVKAKKEIKSVVKNGRINRKAENYVYLCQAEILSNNIEKTYENLALAISLSVAQHIS